MRISSFAFLLVPLALFGAEGWLETEPGVRLRWRSLGEGAPAIVLPGAFLVGEDFDALAARHRLILYDMRNRGASSRVTDPAMLTIEADVRDLEAIRRHFDLESFIPVGYSYLGKMAVLYALAHPERVERIVQIGPVGMRFGEPFPPVHDNTGEQVMDPEALAAVRALRAKGFHESNPEEYCEREWLVTRVRLVGDPSHATKLESYCRMENEWPVRFAFHLDHHFRSAREAHVSPFELAALEVPLLTIHGTKDRNAAYGGGREWAALAPDGRLLTVHGAAHQAWVEDPGVIDAIATFAAGEWPAEAEDLSIAAETWLAQLRGHALLRRALDRAGGETATLRAEWSGTLHLREQSASPSAPFDPFPVEERVTIDAASRRIAFEEELRWPDFTSRSRLVAAGESGVVENLGTGAIRAPVRPPSRQRLRVLERHPNLLLGAALEESGSIRFTGLATVEGERLAVVEATVEDARVAVLIDGDARVRRVRRLVADPLLGDTLRETLLEGDLVRVFSNGELVEELRLRSAEPLGGGGGRTLAIESLAPGVWIVSGIGGADYNALVVEKGDEILLVEAPLGPEAMGEVLERLAARFPEKRVATVVATHHHEDHAGGVPAALAAGARVVTGPRTAALFRAVATASRTIEPAGGARPPSSVVVVEGDRLVLGGDGPAVEVHRIDASPHAAEMLFAWLPEERILFQGDLFVLHPGEPEAARPQARALLEAIERRGLAVERLLGVHGLPATLDDLRAAIRRAGR